VYGAKVSIRCKLHILQTIRSKLSWKGGRLGMFSRTVFGPWLNIQTTLHDNHLLNFLLQHQRFGKISLDPKEKDRSQFHKRVFPETHNLNDQLLLDPVKNDVAFNNLDDDDVVRVCLLLALDYVFMGQEIKHVLLKAIVNLVDNLSEWDKFPWGEYMWRQFHKRVYNVVAKHREYHLNMLGNNPRYVTTPNVDTRGSSSSHNVHTCVRKVVRREIADISENHHVDGLDHKSVEGVSQVTSVNKDLAEESESAAIDGLISLQSYDIHCQPFLSPSKENSVFGCLDVDNMDKDDCITDVKNVSRPFLRQRRLGKACVSHYVPPPPTTKVKCKKRRLTTKKPTSKKSSKLLLEVGAPVKEEMQWTFPWLDDHFRQPNDDWAMASPYLSDMLSRYELPLYADGNKHGVSWFASGVEKVYFSINEKDFHWLSHNFPLEADDSIEFSLMYRERLIEFFSKHKIVLSKALSFATLAATPFQRTIALIRSEGMLEIEFNPSRKYSSSTTIGSLKKKVISQLAKVCFFFLLLLDLLCGSSAFSTFLVAFVCLIILGYCFVGRGRIEAVDSNGHLRLCPSDLGGIVRGHKVDIACFLETKWKGSRAREGNGYKLWYSGSSSARNDVGIILAGRYTDNVVRVTRRGDRIMAISVVIEGEAVNVISAYAPQVGLSDVDKKRFWDALDEMVRECPTNQHLIIGGDLNGHIGAAADGYAEVHGEGRPLNYLSEWGHNTQIDYLLVRRGDLKACKDCRAFPGEACSSHHILIIVDVLLERLRHKREATGRPRILWKNLNGEAVETFRAIVFERLVVEDMSASYADQMWNTFACVMKDAAKDSLGVTSARTHSTHRESWWFCEEVQTKVATKQSRFKDLISCSEGNQEDIDRAKKRYKVAKREAKIAVAKAKDKAYEDLYKKLDSKEGVNEIYKIAKARERRRRDIGNVKYIKDEGCRTIVREEDIRTRWGKYFSSIFNVTPSEESRPEGSGEKMGRNKAVGPDQIPIEAWRGLGDEGVKWLTCLFNKIFSSAKMPDEWRLSEVIPVYKNKGDAQACSNYRGIKLLSHTMKLWESVIERRLRRESRVSENQFGFMLGRFATEAIHLLRSLMEKYRER
nr:hypothetical protein [Tanacetum cinerariifolium]